jgi:hypothetical protein
MRILLMEPKPPGQSPRRPLYYHNSRNFNVLHFFLCLTRINTGTISPIFNLFKKSLIEHNSFKINKL